MNIKRAVGVGILTYLIAFIIGMIVVGISGVDATNPAEVPKSVLYINIVITIIIAALLTLFYFKGKHTKANVKEGLLFGIVLVIVGFILDIIIFLIFSSASQSEFDLMEYYSNPIFWVSLVLLLITTSVVGWIKGRKKRK